MPRTLALATEISNGVTCKYSDNFSDFVSANPLGLLHTIARTPDIYSLYVRKNEMETYLTHLMQMEADLMLPLHLQMQLLSFD